MEHTRNRGAWFPSRMICVILSVAMCALLLGRTTAAFAEENETKGTEATAALDETETVEPKVTPEEMKAACAALRQAQEEISANGEWSPVEDILRLVQGDNAAYLREDVLAALESWTSLLTARKELSEARIALTEKIAVSTDLSDMDRSAYLAALDTLEPSSAEPEAKLAEALETLGEALVSTESVDQSLAEFQEKKTSLTELDEVLDTLYLWKQIDEQLAALESTIQTNGSAETVREQAAAFVERRDKLKADAAAYFTLPLEEQMALAEGIAQLDKDLSGFGRLVALDNSALISEQNTQLNALQRETERLNGQLVMVYIALGISGLGVLMAAVSGIFSLNTSKMVRKQAKHQEEKMESLGRRDEVLQGGLDALDGKTDILEGRVDKLCTQAITDDTRKRNEETSAQGQWEPETKSEELSAPPSMEHSPEEKLSGDSTKPAQDSVPVPVQSQEAVSKQDLPKRVCNLGLQYKNVSPDYSFLMEDPRGKYSLFDDGTVDICTIDPNTSNTLKGWRDSGDLFLFDPEVDGRVVNQNENLPGGYCMTLVRSRAKVEKHPGGSYICVSKGRVVMEKAR